MNQRGKKWATCRKSQLFLLHLHPAKAAHHQSLDHLALPYNPVFDRQDDQTVRAPETPYRAAPLTPGTPRPQSPVRPYLHHRPVILGSSRVASHFPLQHHLYLWKSWGAEAGGVLQGGQDEEMEGRDSGGRVAGEGENETGLRVARVGFAGDGGESGRFARFHRHAAEMDGPAEGALDGRFEQVELAHGDAAGGDDDVDAAHGCAQSFFEGAGRVGGDAQVDGFEAPAADGGENGRAVAVADFA